MAKDPTMINSINRMELSDRSEDPKDFPHYARIADMFDTAKKKAWATLSKRQDVKVLIQKRKDALAQAASKKQDINSENSLLRLTEQFPN